jgi:hypothetical protein
MLLSCLDYVGKGRRGFRGYRLLLLLLLLDRGRTVRQAEQGEEVGQRHGGPLSGARIFVRAPPRATTDKGSHGQEVCSRECELKELTRAKFP